MKNRQLTFKLFLVLTVIITVELIGMVGMKLLDVYDPYKAYFPERYKRLRDVLAKREGALPRYVGAANINFMPTPGYTIFGKVQHNEDGYRGEKVPLQKGKCYRILFLGGSTTYGSGVKSPIETFPAKTKYWIEKSMGDSQSPKCIDVINAGLEGGHSCDELNLYLHKYRYYKPDLVVLHSGGNDAEFNIVADDFTPDLYNSNPPEMYQIYRHHIPAFLFKSNLFSFVVIRFFIQSSFNHDQPRGRPEVSVKCNWYNSQAKKEIVENNFIESPFQKNVSTLIREVYSDSAEVLLIPFALNNSHSSAFERPDYVKQVAIYNSILSVLKKKYETHWLDYKYESIDSICWLDDCHLDSNGESQKGRLISDEILKIINCKENYNE